MLLQNHSYASERRIFSLHLLPGSQACFYWQAQTQTWDTSSQCAAPAGGQQRTAAGPRARSSRGRGAHPIWPGIVPTLPNQNLEVARVSDRACRACVQLEREKAPRAWILSVYAGDPVLLFPGSTLRANILRERRARVRGHRRNDVLRKIRWRSSTVPKNSILTTMHPPVRKVVDAARICRVEPRP